MLRLSRLRFLLLLLALLTPSLAQVCDARAGAPMQMQIQLAFGHQASDSTPGAVATQNDSMHRGGDAAGVERGHEFPPEMQIRIRLEDPSGGTLQELTPTAEGQVRFMVCTNSIYRVRVIGPTIEEALLDSVQPGRGDKLLTVVLHPKLTDQERKTRKEGRGKTTTVSIQHLRIPKKAQKQSDKGDAALQRGQLEAAAKYYINAIEIYPKFEEAEDKLGVVLMQQGKRAEGKAAFERALAVNGNYASAEINLAKIALDDKRYGDAYSFARQALTTEPLNPGALFIAAESSFFKGEYSETISYTRSLHSLPHQQYALAHFLAAKSLEAEGQSGLAITEYQTFLEEDPKDANAPRARELLAILAASRTPAHILKGAANDRPQ